MVDFNEKSITNVVDLEGKTADSKPVVASANKNTKSSSNKSNAKKGAK